MLTKLKQLLLNDSTDETKRLVLDLSAITTATTRTLTIPDANGTIALTSNLSNYLPLAGGTLTGNLILSNAKIVGNTVLDLQSNNVTNYSAGWFYANNTLTRVSFNNTSGAVKNGVEFSDTESYMYHNNESVLLANSTTFRVGKNITNSSYVNYLYNGTVGYFSNNPTTDTGATVNINTYNITSTWRTNNQTVNGIIYELTTNDNSFTGGSHNFFTFRRNTLTYMTFDFSGTNIFRFTVPSAQVAQFRVGTVAHLNIGGGSSTPHVGIYASASLSSSSVRISGTNTIASAGYNFVFDRDMASTVSSSMFAIVGAFTGVSTSQQIYIDLSPTFSTTNASRKIAFRARTGRSGFNTGTSDLESTVDIVAESTGVSSDYPLYVKDSALTMLFRLSTNGNYNFKGGVATAQSTGWSITNPVTLKTLDVSTGSLLDVKKVLGTLIDTLKNHGIILG